MASPLAYDWKQAGWEALISRRRTRAVGILAWKNLLEDVPRFIVALAGIIFAVTLLTVQIGLFNGFAKSTSLAIEQSTADLWIAEKHVAFFEITLPLSYEHLAKIRAIPGVARAQALSIHTVLWRSPRNTLQGARVIGFDPRGGLFAAGFAPDLLRSLERPYAIAIDGAQRRPLDIALGETATIGQLPAHVVGLTQGTQPIVSPPFLYASLETANAYAPSPLSFFTPSEATTPEPLTESDQISYVLVKRDPRVPLATLERAIAARLPDVRVLTRDELLQMTRAFWVGRTSIGFVLSLIAVMGLSVGVIIVGQILYTSVNEHLREYGTLRAMGTSDGLLYLTIAQQASFMAVLGYVPSLVFSIFIQTLSASHGVQILITPTTAGIVFLATIGMCIGAGVFAMHRVMRTDPAMVFRA